jgi:hypothetical protein
MSGGRLGTPRWRFGLRPLSAAVGYFLNERISEMRESTCAGVRSL